MFPRIIPRTLQVLKSIYQKHLQQLNCGHGGFFCLMSNAFPIDSWTVIKGINWPRLWTGKTIPHSTICDHRPNPAGGNFKACQYFQIILTTTKRNKCVTTNPVKSKCGTRNNSGETTSVGGMSDNAESAISEGTNPIWWNQVSSKYVPHKKSKQILGDTTTHNSREQS